MKIIFLCYFYFSIFNVISYAKYIIFLYHIIVYIVYILPIVLHLLNINCFIYNSYNKNTFGSQALADMLYFETLEQDQVEIELIGLCTDICVVSNAILIKTRLPEVTVIVDASCCAGVTPESHEAALTTLKMCQCVVK